MINPSVVNENIIAQIFNTQPDSVLWLLPVFDNANLNEVVDFKVAYCNNAACSMLGETAEIITGAQLNNSFVLGAMSARLMTDQAVKAWTTGESVEYTYYSESLDKYFDVQSSKVKDGILTITRDRTVVVRSLIENEQQTKQFKSTIDNAPCGLIWYDAVTEGERVVDFRPKVINEISAKLTGLTVEQINKLTLCEFSLMDGDESKLLSAIKVFDCGTPVYKEYFSTQSQTWLGLSIVRAGGGVLLHYMEINQMRTQQVAAGSSAKNLEAILNASLHSAYLATVITGAHGEAVDLEIQQVNARFCKMIGKTTGEIVGARLTSITDHQQDEFISYVQRATTTGTPLRAELYYSATREWFEFSMLPISHEQVMVTFHDVTAHKENMEESNHQKSILYNLLKYSPCGITVSRAIRDSSGSIVDVIGVLANERATQLTGLSQQELKEKTAVQIDPDLRNNAIFQAANKTKPNGEPVSAVYFLPHTQKWLEVSISRMDEDHFINVLSDITPLRQTQLELEKTVASLHENNSYLTQFAYAASHDLKEPIRKILYYASLLSDSPEKMADVLPKIDKSSRRMIALVDNLLALAAANRDMEQFVIVDLNEIVEAVLEDYDLLIKEKGARLQCSALPQIRAITEQMRQLFTNLIGNALKYVHSDAVPHITITCERLTDSTSLPIVINNSSECHYWHIAIKDNGIGFEPEEANSIFTIFHRLHSQNNFPGTGVGLALCEKVVTNHNGAISAEGMPGAGAIFHIYLPAIQ